MPFKYLYTFPEKCGILNTDERPKGVLFYVRYVHLHMCIEG